MYSLARALPKRRLVWIQLPALMASLVLAELFFKFHSFTLECLAFLATWTVLDFVLAKTIPAAERSASSRVS